MVPDSRPPQSPFELNKEIDISPWIQNLSLSSEGLWVSPKTSPVSYHTEDNENYFRVEAESFWFKHRNDCLLEIFRRFPPGGVLFDVGGGNGFVASDLNQKGVPTVLVEPGPAGARNAKVRGVPQVICSTFQDAGFADHSLPAVGLFDVLEHIEDDHFFLKILKTKLKKKGRIYLTVPAYPWLWSAEDARAGHYRRYTRGNITRLLLSEGFHVDYAAYFFGILILPIFMARAIPYRLGLVRTLSGTQKLSEHQAPTGLFHSFLNVYLKWERKRLSRGIMRWGSSCIITAQSLA
jgi:SAM-dependent methyltransferase